MTPSEGFSKNTLDSRKYIFIVINSEKVVRFHDEFVRVKWWCRTHE